MAQSIESVLPRIRSLAKRYAGPCVGADDLESVGVLAVIEAERNYLGLGDWVAFAVRVAQNRMRDEVRRSVKYDRGRVLYDALSSSATIVMLRHHALSPATAGVQDETAYVAQVMDRISTNALGKTLFAESLSGKVSCRAESKRRRRAKSRWAHARALKAAKMQAEALISEE